MRFAVSRLSLLFDTIKHMKMVQLRSQLRGRYAVKASIPPVKMVAFKYRPHLFISELDADSEVASRFLPEKILEDEVTLLNQSRRVDFAKMRVSEGDITPLWRFNLSYCEYAIALMLKGRQENDRRCLSKAKEIFVGAACDFEKKGPGRAPYVLSLQTVNLLIARDMMEPFRQYIEKREDYFFEADLYRKYTFLKKHTEKHLLANHYLENLKALLILSIAFGEAKEVQKYLNLLKAELDEQILPDGMHYERSFMYHKLILEDLLRVVLSAQDTPWEDEVRDTLAPYIRRMSIVTDMIETGLSRTPLFNDSADNVAKPAAKLLQAAKRLGFLQSGSASGTKKAPDDGYAFPHAGYYRMNREDIALVMAATKVGPSYNPGHNHNDCLSFEFFVKGRPVFVNSGCYSYFGPKRAYQRSVAAHNTFSIDGTEHSECWASHRVARRLSDVQMTMDEDGFFGRFTDYAGHVGQRTVLFEKGSVTVTDSCIDENPHVIRSYLHLEPHFTMEKTGEKLLLVTDDKGLPAFSIEILQGETKLLSKSSEHPYSPELGVSLPVDVLIVKGSLASYSIKWE